MTAPGTRKRGGHSALRQAATSGAWLIPSFLIAYCVADSFTRSATARTVWMLLLVPVIGAALRFASQSIRHAWHTSKRR